MPSKGKVVPIDSGFKIVAGHRVRPHHRGQSLSRAEPLEQIGWSWIRRRYLVMIYVLHLSAEALTNPLTGYPAWAWHFVALRAVAAISIAVRDVH